MFERYYCLLESLIRPLYLEWSYLALYPHLPLSNCSQWSLCWNWYCYFLTKKMSLDGICIYFLMTLLYFLVILFLFLFVILSCMSTLTLTFRVVNAILPFVFCFRVTMMPAQVFAFVLLICVHRCLIFILLTMLMTVCLLLLCIVMLMCS